MVNQALLQSFLLQLEEKTGLLRTTPVDSLGHLQKEPILHNAILHLLQTSIEICLDISNHIIADEGWRAPTSNRDAFAILSEHDVIDAALLTKCQHMAGFRNILVHMYEKVDLADVYAVLKNHLDDFADFTGAIKNFLPSA